MLDRLRLALAILRHKHPMYPIGLSGARVKRVSLRPGHLTITLTAQHDATVIEEVREVSTTAPTQTLT